MEEEDEPVVTEVEKQCADARRNITGRIEVDFRQSLNREELLKHAVAETKSEYDKLNARSFEYQQLKREADASLRTIASCVSSRRLWSRAFCVNAEM